MEGYSQQEINLLSEEGIKRKHTECDVLPITELIQLLKEGWVIYDTKATEDKDIKLLTLARINSTAQ